MVEMNWIDLIPFLECVEMHRVPDPLLLLFAHLLPLIPSQYLQSGVDQLN